MNGPRERVITLRVQLGRRGLAGALCAGLLLAAPIGGETEQLTLTTYYPSPYGVYENMRATRDAYLAYSGGRVGIGTATPSSSHKLDVSGNAQVQGRMDVTANATVGSNITAAGGQLTLGAGPNGNHVERTGDLIIGGTSGRVRIGTNTGYYLSQMCRNINYGFGNTVYCPNNGRGWVAVAWYGSGGRITGGNVPITGGMVCCKLEQF